MTSTLVERLAAELAVAPRQVEATVALLDGGATVPFVARYRKEATGGLTDVQLRQLDERLTYLRELDERRASVLASIEEQGKLTPELRASIERADTKQRLEDLYLPYKQKRRTKAQIAREAGLAPLAESLLADATLDPQAVAVGYVDESKGVADAAAALEGARQILMETFAEHAELLGQLRERLHRHARLQAKVVEGKEAEGAKFRDWFDHVESLAKLPSHRMLALLRGRNEGVLRLTMLAHDDPEPGAPAAEFTPYEGRIAEQFGIADRGRPADRFLLDAVKGAWRSKIFPHLDVELMVEAKERAEAEAIHVFGQNLGDLLLAAPAGPRTTMGLDPGLRTGVKVAVVDATGKVLDTATIYPHVPRNDWDRSLDVLHALVVKHGVDLVAIGNGTASRETDKLAADLQKRVGGKLQKVVVSEAGASVYSASELASNELPDLDVSLRGAVSIARRLQDPLAELVKIEPKAIGVGQYQHDVSQSRLSRKLDGVVEDCVNSVGVDVNTASPALLARVSGLGESLAKNIVAHRDASGAFRSRKQLLDVPRLGAKAFEQAAGFLRIRDSQHPLDASAVHPEAYGLVERIAKTTGKELRALIGDVSFLRTLKPEQFVDAQFGLPTVRDILAELEKPGRDPRPEFAAATFAEGVNEVADLKPDMVLEGVVTNVTAFGAFVDVGVHQDGLVHISRLSHAFVADPREVVKAGQVVRVKVLEVDVARQRIALSMRLDDKAGERPSRGPSTPAPREAHAPKRREAPAPPSALAQALAKLNLKPKS